MNISEVYKILKNNYLGNSKNECINKTLEQLGNIDISLSDDIINVHNEIIKYYGSEMPINKIILSEIKTLKEKTELLYSIMDNVKCKKMDEIDEYLDKNGLLNILNRELIYAGESRLVDYSNNITFYLYLKGNIINAINSEGNKEIFGDISVRPKSYEKKINDEDVLLHYRECGINFDYVIKNLPEITKLCDENYKNHLWIIRNGNNLCIEELLYGDYESYPCIRTVLLHLKYNDSFITHMDIEYIYYSHEEFENKKKDARQHGKYFHKEKIIKFDNMQMPIDYSVDFRGEKVLFLYFILYNYSNNIDLLNEYFAKYINN